MALVQELGSEMESGVSVPVLRLSGLVCNMGCWAETWETDAPSTQGARQRFPDKGLGKVRCCCWGLEPQFSLGAINEDAQRVAPERP